MRTPRLTLFIATATRFRRLNDGSTVVEFALLLPVFLAVLFMIFEIGLAFFAEQTLETATQDAARLIFTGSVQTNKLDATAFKNEICNRSAALLKCENLTVDVRPLNSVSPNPIVNGVFTVVPMFNTGNAGDTVKVIAYYQWPVLVTSLGFDYSNIIGGKRLLISTFGFKNEPYEGS